jgi:[ribosomal protein S5]-alanine N-acetyltransferase
MIDLDKMKTLEGKRIYLRFLMEEDVTEQYCSWINDPEINEYLEAKSTTFEDQKRYIRDKFHDTSCLFYGIFTKESDLHIGNVKLEPVNDSEKPADISVIIGEKEFWGKGFSTEAYTVLIRHLFRNDLLGKITTGCYKENIGAFKIAQKIGFSIISEEERLIRMKLEKSDFKFLE